MDRIQTRSLSGMNLTLAEIEVRKGQVWPSELPAGLWCGIVAAGRIGIESDAFSGDIEDQTAFSFFADEPVSVDHTGKSDCTLSSVFIHIPVDELQATFGDESNRFTRQEPGDIFLSDRCSQILSTMALQMLIAPPAGVVSEYYVTGKAFEVFSMVLAEQSERASKHTIYQQTGLHSHEIERVHHARDLLLSSLQSPPSLSELAKGVGLNTSRLRLVFRVVFGETITVFLRNARLDAAKLQIEASGFSVSEAARAYGFSVAHFSTIFRQRFGYSPSGLRQRKGT